LSSVTVSISLGLSAAALQSRLDSAGTFHRCVDYFKLKTLPSALCADQELARVLQPVPALPGRRPM
jgi:hypothetical protein